MSDNTAETTTDKTTEPDAETTETPEVKTEPQGTADTDWKAEARKWESRSKSDREMATKWREYENGQKSDNEKLIEDLATAQAEATQASVELLRYRIASEKGITGEATKLLKGSTLEELESEAELLLSLIENQSKPKTPRPDENQGRPASAVLGQLTKDDLKGMTPVQIMEAKNAGRLNDALGKN